VIPSFVNEVPLWTSVAAFAAGLLVGGLAGRLLFRGRSPAAPPIEAEQREPEQAAGAVAADARVEEAEPLVAGVKDVVEELERRYHGRRAEGEADKPVGGQSGQR
jgi:hypothetical protein